MRYDILARAVEVLKNMKFLEERIDPGLPARWLIWLTERGKQVDTARKEIT